MRRREDIAEHYRIEKELAKRLRDSSKEERRRLYTFVYNELFRRVQDHPQVLQRANPERPTLSAARRIRLLKRFLKPESTFLELGAGDCRLALEVAKRVRKVYAVEVSGEIAKGLTLPPNLELIVSDGIDIPVPAGSIAVAYSNQLMEHLHPDDALEHLRAVSKALAPAGVYVCVTPNRFSGPHDVSKYFDDVATGLHLREYSLSELEDLFRLAGFSQIYTYGGGRGVYFRSFPRLVRMCEAIIGGVSPSIRKGLANTPLFRALLGVILVGKKDPVASGDALGEDQ